MEEQENTEEIKSFEDLSKTEKNENDMILPEKEVDDFGRSYACLLYTSPSPRD